MISNFSLVLRSATTISHGDTHTSMGGSNIRLFMRKNVKLDRGVAMRIPAISENSLRSIIFRQPLANHLIETLELNNEDLYKTVVNFIYSGGNLMSNKQAKEKNQEEKTTENKKKGADSNEFSLAREVMKNYPSFELLGGATDRFILPQSALSLCAWPITKEYTETISLVAGKRNDSLSKEESEEIVEKSRNISVFDLVSEETRTRGTGGESDGNQILYTYETLAEGSEILLRIAFDHGSSDLAKSAAAFALKEWDGFFGGQRRQGHGLIMITKNTLKYDGLYEQYIIKNKEMLRSGLIDGSFGTDYELCGK